MAPSFKGLLIDAYGVLYDGKGMLPGAIETLSHLQSQQIPIILVTNNSMMCPADISHMVYQLSGLTIPESHILSSGRGLAIDPICQSAIRHQPVFVVGSQSSHWYISDANGHIVTDLSAASTVVLTASQPDYASLYEDVIAEKNNRPTLRIICSNPDRYVQTGANRFPVIGYYADYIESQTGQPLIWMGKPYSNFSQVVDYYVRTVYPNFNPSNWVFVDDNIDNVTTLVTDLGISGRIPIRTGLAQSEDWKTIELPPTISLLKTDLRDLL